MRNDEREGVIEDERGNCGGVDEVAALLFDWEGVDIVAEQDIDNVLSEIKREVSVKLEAEERASRRQQRVEDKHCDDGVLERLFVLATGDMGEHRNRQINAENHENKPIVCVFAAEHDVVEDGFRGESQELRIAHDKRLPEIHEDNPADCRYEELHEALLKESFRVVFFAVAEQSSAGNHNKNRHSITEEDFCDDV